MSNKEISKLPQILVEATSLSGERSGIGRYTFELINALAEQGANLHLVTLSEGNNDEELRLISKNITHLNRRAQQLIWTIMDYFTFLKVEYFLKSTPNFIIYPNFKYLPTRLPSLTFIHDISYTKGQNWGSAGFIRRITRWGERSINSNTTITTISSTIAREISEYYRYPIEKILIINPGIAQTMLEVKATTESKVKKGFLVVGTFEKRKNLAFIIQAYNNLTPQEQFDNPLTLVGRIGNDYEKISTLAKQNLNINLVPNIKDAELITLYQNSLFLISSSNYEGYGMQVAEAMYFGLGLILSDIAVHREVSGSYAKFFALNDVNNLTTLLQSQPEEYPQEFLSQASNMAQNYRWEVAAKKILSYFNF